MKKMKILLCFCIAIILLGSGASQLLAARTQTKTTHETEQPEPTRDQITMDNWAAACIERATSLGLVPPTFADLTQPITRAEFTALAVRLYEKTTGAEVPGRMEFNDTSDTNVQKMGYLGVVTGVGGGNFAPNSTLTREQAAVMISRLAYVIGQPFQNSETTFADRADISSWAVEAVGQMRAYGIMSGTGNNNFSPKQDYTIQQSIVTMLRLFDILTVSEHGCDMPVRDIPYPSDNQNGPQEIPAPEGLTMIISSYTASGLSFYFENSTDKMLTYGEDFALYKFVDDTWERVEPTIEGYWGFISIGYDIPPNSSTNERTVDWVWLFGELPSGDYKFQKHILYVRQPGDFDSFVLEREFTLP